MMKSSGEEFFRGSDGRRLHNTVIEGKGVFDEIHALAEAVAASKYYSW
jgi:hypothetical protein